MNIQLKRLALLAGFGAILVLASNNAFALGRGHKSGYRGWSTTTSGGGSDTVSNGGSINDNQETGNGGNDGTTVPPVRDSNPVPEPASLVLFGSALAGLGGYRGLRSRLARR